VDADQLVVVAGRRYDAVLGYSGAEGAIYPGLSDEATRQQVCSHLSLMAPTAKPWSARREAAEVAWLLGSPFAVEVVEGPGEDVLHVIAGTTDVADEGIDLLNDAWRISVGSLADVVVAAISGDMGRHTFPELAAASAAAARVVKPGGGIVLLTSASAISDESVEFLRHVQDAESALKLLKKVSPSGMAAAYQWASAANRATLYLMSDMPDDLVEDLFAIPLESVTQLQRLIDSRGSRLFLSDAHKTLAVPPEIEKN
jgi:nickel-dependent lactate racemase